MEQLEKFLDFFSKTYFWKISEFFQKYFFGKLFEILKKYFLVGIFFLTRYDHLVCINNSFANPQAPCGAQDTHTGRGIRDFSKNHQNPWIFELGRRGPS